MPDRLPSTKHPLHPTRFRTSTKLRHGIPSRGWGNPCKFAHLSRNVSGIFESHDAKLSMMKLAGNLI
jgi:hypothetical protein